MYGAGGGAPTGASGAKFTSQMFGQTLLKGMAQKENTTTSQMFPSGSFQKYIGGDGMSDKSEPKEGGAPLGNKEQNLVKQFGSPNAPSFFSSHQKNESSGGSSFKSLTNMPKEGPGASDETSSNY